MSESKTYPPPELIEQDGNGFGQPPEETSGVGTPSKVVEERGEWVPTPGDQVGSGKSTTTENERTVLLRDIHASLKKDIGKAKWLLDIRLIEDDDPRLVIFSRKKSTDPISIWTLRPEDFSASSV